MVTQKRLRQIMRYEEESGKFFYIVHRSCMVPGIQCGSLDPKRGYRRINVDGVKYLAHRLVWVYVYGVWPSGVIDHIDHNKDNNRLNNLRDVSLSVNQHNRIEKQRNSRTSKMIGIHFNAKQKQFIAKIKVSGKSIYLGGFDDEISAHNAYVDAKKKYHPSAPINNIKGE